jgi:hypothetical protein
MDERVKELRRLDELEATDLWERIQENRGGERLRARSRGRRVWTLVFAMLIAAGGIGVALYSLTPRIRPPAGGNRGECARGTDLKDPACPGPRWLRAVLTSAGFDVLDLEAETTLVGRSEDAKFNMWIRPDDFPFETLPLHDEIAGIRIYGFGRTEYLVWRVQGQIVSVASFSKDYEGVPTGQELHALVRATIDTPFSPAPSQGDTSLELAAGTSDGTPWRLVATGAEPTGIELRWNDDQSIERAIRIEPKTGLAVGWRTFGRFDPDDAVVFGIASLGVSSVIHVPGQGLPETQVDVVDVPGVDWSAFVLTTYAAIGIVEADEAGTADPPDVLIVPQGGAPVLDTVEAFLAARIAGDAAESYLAPGTASEFGRNGVSSLYRGFEGGAFVRSKVLFLDPAGGEWEVGVRLEANDGTTAEDTLFVTRTDSSEYAIIGLRSGTIGP